MKLHDYWPHIFLIKQVEPSEDLNRMAPLAVHSDSRDAWNYNEWQWETQALWLQLRELSIHQSETITTNSTNFEKFAS